MRGGERDLYGCARHMVKRGEVNASAWKHERVKHGFRACSTIHRFSIKHFTKYCSHSFITEGTHTLNYTLSASESLFPLSPNHSERQDNLAPILRKGTDNQSNR